MDHAEQQAQLAALEAEEANAMTKACAIGSRRWRVARPFVYTASAVLLLVVIGVLLYIMFVPADAKVLTA